MAAPVQVDLVEHLIEGVDASSHSAEVVAAGAIVHDLGRLHLGLLLEFVDDLPPSIVARSAISAATERLSMDPAPRFSDTELGLSDTELPLKRQYRPDLRPM